MPSSSAAGRQAAGAADEAQATPLAPNVPADAAQPLAAAANVEHQPQGAAAPQSEAVAHAAEGGQAFAAQQADDTARQQRMLRERQHLAELAARLEQENRAVAPPAAAQAYPAEAPQQSAGAAAPTVVKGSQAFVLGGIATGVIALLLIGGGGLWWSLRHPAPGRAAAVAGASAPPSASSPVAVASAPVGKTAVAASAGVAAKPAAGQSAAPAAAPVSPPAAQAAAAPARPEQPQEVTRHASSPAAKPRGTSHPAAPVQRQAQTLTPAPQPPAAPAPVEPAAQAVAPAEPKPPGRVEALRQALAACGHKGNFFTQQLCIQEARWTYCGAPLSPDPLWGKVAECPSAAQQNSP